MITKVDKFIETDKPILICGWDKVKMLYPKQKITNKIISDNVFWTFSEKEKRTENSKDVENFRKHCINEFDSDYTYYFINPFDLNFNKLKKIITKINNIIDNKICYSDGKHLFILTDTVILGLNKDFFLTNINVLNRIIKWLKVKNFNIFKDSSIFNIKGIENKGYLIPALIKEKYEEQLIIGYIFE